MACFTDGMQLLSAVLLVAATLSMPSEVLAIDTGRPKPPPPDVICD